MVSLLPSNFSISDSGERPTAGKLLTEHPFCQPDPNYNFLNTELYAKIRDVFEVPQPHNAFPKAT